MRSTAQQFHEDATGYDHQDATLEQAADFHRAWDIAVEKHRQDAALEDAMLLSWARQQTEGRVFTSEREVLVHLSRQKVIESGRALGLTDSLRMRDVAVQCWRGIEPAVCRNPACGITYVRSEGWGRCCSKACGMAELEAS